MSLHRDEYIDLCAGYALGSLDEGDRARLERHLAEGCEACEKALRDFSIGAQLLAGSLPAEPVGSALRDRVMIAAGSTRQGIPPVPEGEGGDGGERTPAKVIKLDRPRRTSAFPALGWAVAAGFAIAAALFWSKLETARTDLAKLRDEQRWAAVMKAPGARLAQLAPTPQAAAPLKGRAYVDPASGRAVLVLEGVQAPQGRDYELWAIRGGAPRSLGLVHADAAGHAVMHLENVGDPATLAAFAVSLEPKGGAPTPDAPTGPVVLVGKVEG